MKTGPGKNQPAFRKGTCCVQVVYRLQISATCTYAVHMKYATFPHQTLFLNKKQGMATPANSAKCDSIVLFLLSAGIFVPANGKE